MQSPFAKPLDRSFVDFFAKTGMQSPFAKPLEVLNPPLVGCHVGNRRFIRRLLINYRIRRLCGKAAKFYLVELFLQIRKKNVNIKNFHTSEWHKLARHGN
jgi:hypothetical protein